MTPLQKLLIEARAAAAHVAEPAYRRGAAISARAYREAIPVADLNNGFSLNVAGLLSMMEALPALNTPTGITKAGESIAALAASIQAELPKPSPLPIRLHWIEGERA
jgi:hypothetical protein